MTVTAQGGLRAYVDMWKALHPSWTSKKDGMFASPVGSSHMRSRALDELKSLASVMLGHHGGDVHQECSIEDSPSARWHQELLTIGRSTSLKMHAGLVS